MQMECYLHLTCIIPMYDDELAIRAHAHSHTRRKKRKKTVSELISEPKEEERKMLCMCSYKLFPCGFSEFAFILQTGCVCVCLLETDSRAITSIKKRNQRWTLKRNRKRRSRKKTINNVYSLLKHWDAYAYVHVIIVTVFVDIIYAYSLSLCACVCVCMCLGERAHFHGKISTLLRFSESAKISTS